VKFQEYVGDIEQVAAGLEKIRHATVRLAMEATNSSLAVEIDRLRELERVIESRRSSVADNIPVEPSDAAKAELDRMATENDRLMGELERVTSQASLRSNDVAAGTDSKELELEVENLKEEIEALHAEIERLQQLLRSQNEETQILEDALNIASGSASSVATPRKGTPEETQVQLSPRAPGKRGFMVDWERNNGMDPLVRLREARLSVQNLEPADLQKPKGAALLYLEAALKRAAILTTSPGEDAQSTPDPWSCPLHDAISAVEPKEAINIASESIALAKKVDIVKDDATMSSEYSNIAETIENWNQALMNEAELAKVVEEINQSRREVLEIRRGNIDEIRSNNHPTPMVEDILLAVMTTMNDASRKGGWKSIKKRMAKGSIFLREIFEFDATTLAPSHVKAVKKIFAKRPDEFVPEVIAKKGSLALVPLFKWVTSMMKFFDQTQGVSPGLKEHILNRVRAAYADFVEDVSLDIAVKSNRKSSSSAADHSSMMRKKSEAQRANLGRKSINYQRDQHGKVIKNKESALDAVLRGV